MSAVLADYGGAPGYFWKTTELQVLREHYEARGPAYCASLLPGRTLRTIYGKARKLGLNAPRAGTHGKRFARVYFISDHIDAQVREGYMHATKKGAIKALAARLGRPEWWVQKRATQLGVTRSVHARVDAWTPPEVELLQEFASCDIKVICAKLRRAGFDRTPTAVAVKLKRMGVDRTDPDTWQTGELASLLGVSSATVCDWIDRRGLNAEKVPHAGSGKWLVRRGQLRAWIAANPRYIDLRRVDHTWFMDLAFGRVKS